MCSMVPAWSTSHRPELCYRWLIWLVARCSVQTWDLLENLSSVGGASQQNSQCSIWILLLSSRSLTNTTLSLMSLSKFTSWIWWCWEKRGLTAACSQSSFILAVRSSAPHILTDIVLGLQQSPEMIVNAAFRVTLSSFDGCSFVDACCWAHISCCVWDCLLPTKVQYGFYSRLFWVECRSDNLVNCDGF